MPRDDPSVTTVRLVARLPHGDRASDGRMRAAATAALGETDDAGRPWRVEPLFPDGAQGRLADYWVVSGAAPSIVAYDASRTAYDLAARLAAVTGDVVEPDLPSSAYGVEPPPVAPELGADGTPSALAGPGCSGTHLPESDPRTWALDAVGARAAWAVAPPADGRSKGEGAVVASIDTGYTDHPEVAGMFDLTRDWDALTGDDDARDPLERPWYMPFNTPGHGTHTASVIASREARTIVGVAPGCTVVPIRAVKSVVQVFDSDVARAVEVARQRGAHVITMSLGGRGFIGLQDAIRAAVADGIIVMAAAGNKVGVVVAPASYPECLAVAATNAQGRPWVESSRGSMVDLAAPGESVWAASVDSTTNPPTFRECRGHGTSFAVACLAGVAALWVAHHGHETIVARYGRGNVQAAFLTLLRSHGHYVPPGWDAASLGVGIVDAHGLLAAGLPELGDLDAVTARAAADGAVGRLQSVLADEGRDQVRAQVATLMGVADPDIEGLPQTAVSELVYRIGEDDELRATLRAGTEPEAGLLGPRPDGRTLLARTCSRALREWGR
ncbi:S8 family peptidase [Georgenia sp. AZ-5]|uniref:S8 family peptidase n=1 Tax=Georgenia sp. AZ-5 TaxID=3367526 RepID=UPI003754E5C8